MHHAAHLKPATLLKSVAPGFHAPQAVKEKQVFERIEVSRDEALGMFQVRACSAARTSA